VVICLQQSANSLHVVQLIPLPPTSSLVQQNPEWFILLVSTHPGSPGQRVQMVVVVVVVVVV